MAQEELPVGRQNLEQRRNLFARRNIGQTHRNRKRFRIPVDTLSCTCRDTRGLSIRKAAAWVKQKNNFEYVFCLDVSRWVQFQDIDLLGLWSACGDRLSNH